MHVASARSSVPARSLVRLVRAGEMLVCSRVRISAGSLSPRAIPIVYSENASLPILKRATATTERKEETATEGLKLSNRWQHHRPRRPSLSTPGTCLPVRRLQGVRLIVQSNPISTRWWGTARAISPVTTDGRVCLPVNAHFLPISTDRAQGISDQLRPGISACRHGGS